MLGLDRCWPEVFDAICVIASEDAEAVSKARAELESKHRRERLAAEAKRRYG